MVVLCCACGVSLSKRPGSKSKRRVESSRDHDNKITIDSNGISYSSIFLGRRVESSVANVKELLLFPLDNNIRCHSTHPGHYYQNRKENKFSHVSFLLFLACKIDSCLCCFSFRLLFSSSVECLCRRFDLLERTMTKSLFVNIPSHQIKASSDHDYKSVGCWQEFPVS